MAGRAPAAEDAELDSREESGADDEQLDLLGVLDNKIVGIQYYEGEVNRNEMVMLVREPSNQYDQWAIRVDNVRGQKVGHLPRVLVCHLAPLIDQGMLQVEGIVPGGTTNKFHMPVRLFLYAPSEHLSRVESRLLSARLMPGSPGRANASTAAGSPDAAASPGRLTARQMEDGLDRLFEELEQSRHAGRPRPRLNPGPQVTSALYQHQQQALAWMVARENSNALPPFWTPRLAQPFAALTYVSQLTNFISTTRPAPLRGGILADDMGLGKTLVVISLICTNRPGVERHELQPLPETDEGPGGEVLDLTQDEGPAEEGAAAEGEAGPQKEVVDLTEEEGAECPPSKRQRTGTQAAAAKKKKGAAASGSQPRAKSKLEARAEELAAAAEGAPTLPAADGPRGTLIVCPLSVLSNWETQLQDHTQGNLQVLVYHGPERDRRIATLAQYDVVITTYAILAQEADKQNGVCKVDWLRVVLDEAHTVRNPLTKMSKAAHSLSAQRRWAVTGTPLQNRLQDLHGICRFLRLEPLDDRKLFTRTIDRPMRERDPAALKRIQVLMGAVALRRTKEQQVGGRPLVDLPAKLVNAVTVQLDAATRAKYERWQAAGRAIVSRLLAQGTLLENYTAVLTILLRLRQICCHASLAPGEEPAFMEQAQGGAAVELTPELVAELVELLKAGLDDECPICLGEMAGPVITRCKHLFCRRCIELVISRDKACCPLCRSKVSVQELVEVPPEEAAASTQEEAASGSGAAAGGAAAPEVEGSGAKIAALLDLLWADADAPGPSNAPPIKHVVFSQFTSFLDLVGAALTKVSISTARIDGHTSAKRRRDVLRDFQAGAAGGPRVLLVSLKAGGVGLNLTAASRVHLLDPWWNPAVEAQAMDRVHRLGQTREVHIYRYCVEDSIEERMLALQEQKRDLMNAAWDDRRPEEAVRQMRINDVRMLMAL